MSRGHGRWQRVILTALETYDLGTVGTIAHNHLGRDPTRPESVAIRRAARRLAEDGAVRALRLGECLECEELSEIWRCPKCGAGCRQVLAVARTGMTGIRSAMPINGVPPWVSVALDSDSPKATLSGRG